MLPSFRFRAAGNEGDMPVNPQSRRILSFALGIATIFDLTGAVVYQTMRPRIPPPPPEPADSDPFRSAMAMIMTAHREAGVQARNESIGTLAE